MHGAKVSHRWTDKHTNTQKTQGQNYRQVSNGETKFTDKHSQVKKANTQNTISFNGKLFDGVADLPDQCVINDVTEKASQKTCIGKLLAAG